MKWFPDGLLVVLSFEEMDKSLSSLIKYGCIQDKRVIWFNDSKDRYIAEKRSYGWICNPQILGILNIDWNSIPTMTEKEVYRL